MGWVWDDDDKKDDPTKQLDPGLKEYLDKEAPAKYEPTKETTAPTPPLSYREQVKQAEIRAQEEADSDPNKPKVPSASLYPDGRYAHIWKDYKPLDQIEGPSTNPVERVVEHFDKRKGVMNKAALENCAEEHVALSTCFKTGDFANKVKARMTMCQFENTKFARCYTMQHKFLQSLGYGSSFEWERGKAERIQMHADKLYHQMLDYEEKVAEAKAAGLEPPSPKSLFNPDYTRPENPAGSDEVEIPGGEQLPPGTRLQKKLKDLTPHERELEVRALKQQIEQRKIYSTEVAPVLQKEDEQKMKRREKFSQWFGPTVGKWLA